MLPRLVLELVHVSINISLLAYCAVLDIIYSFFMYGLFALFLYSCFFFVLLWSEFGSPLEFAYSMLTLFVDGVCIDVGIMLIGLKGVDGAF